MSVEVLTFGCRLNAAESEAMRRAAEAAGRQNVTIVNTCAVTGEAVRQARQQIRRLKREAPERAIVVTGCAVQTDVEMFSIMPEISQIIGNDIKLTKSAFQVDFGIGTAERVRVGDIMAMREQAGHMAEAFEDQTRAFLQIQNGCDHRCTFCIIPFGRGPSRSVPMGEVIATIRRLIEKGSMEVVLTGVDLTSYGQDLPGTPKLGSLVKSILRHVPELRRLRLSSVDSIEIDHDLMDCFADEARLMPHLHLSLQAGDDLILKRMKRRHARADAIAICDQLRRLRPDIVFGADLIAGFPTETEAQFSRSLDIVEECGLTHLHVFPFSPRKGTPAARMPQVAPVIAKDRARRLRERGDEQLEKHLAMQAGKSVMLLAERGGIGRAEDFTPALLPLGVPPGTPHPSRPLAYDGEGEGGGRSHQQQSIAPGALVTATVTGHDGKRLLVSHLLETRAA
jgi:threonylcarbamoyladenosine tRNA methylthiotransferase MtaB